MTSQDLKQIAEIIDQRIKPLEEKIDTLDMKVDRGFDRLDKKIDQLREETTEMFTGQSAGLDDHDRRLTRVETHLQLSPIK